MTMTEPDRYCKRLKDPEIGRFGFWVLVRLTLDVEKIRSLNGTFSAPAVTQECAGLIIRSEPFRNSANTKVDRMRQETGRPRIEAILRAAKNRRWLRAAGGFFCGQHGRSESESQCGFEGTQNVGRPALFARSMSHSFSQRTYCSRSCWKVSSASTVGSVLS